MSYSISIFIVCIFLFVSNLSASLAIVDRQQIINQLRSATKARYTGTGFNISEKKLDDLFDSCIKNEADFIYENSKLEFSDRFKTCVASLKNTHFRALDLTPIPDIYLGFSVTKVDSKYLVSAINPFILNHLKNNGYPNIIDQLKIGKEVLSVDSDSTAARVEFLEKFIPGSTQAYINRKATQALTFRNFSLPKSGFAEINLEGEIIRFPWWSVGVNLRADSRKLFKELDIKNFNRVDPSFSLAFSAPENLNQQLGWSSKSNLANELISKYFDTKGQLGLITGVINKLGAKSCYIKVLTFDSKSWQLKAAGSSVNLNFEEPLKIHLKYCTDNNLPLILDLMHNSGGDSDLVQKLFFLLKKADVGSPSILFSGRVTDYLTEVIGQYELGDNFPELPIELSHERRRLESLKIAQNNQLPYLPFTADAPPKISSTTFFSNDIVTMTGPECVSACEILVELMRHSKRSIIIGEPTAGTGMGYNQNSLGSSSTEFRDDIFGTLRVLIPNIFFGVIPAIANQTEFFLPFETYKVAILEGKPSQPDFIYQTQTKDLNESGRGWLETATGLFLPTITKH